MKPYYLRRDFWIRWAIYMGAMFCSYVMGAIAVMKLLDVCK